MRLATQIKTALIVTALCLGLQAAIVSARQTAPGALALNRQDPLTRTAAKTRALIIPNPNNAGIVEIKPDELAGYKRIVAISDTHGMYYEVWHLLMASGIIEMSTAPEMQDGKATGALKWKPQWHGANTLLVVTGDSIDKGPQPLELLKLWYDLQQQKQGNNRIVALLGNHEAEYLADPLHKKSLTTHQELVGQGYKPDDLANPAFATRDGYPLGKFMRSLPLAARVGDWLFSHAGWLPDAATMAPGQSDPAARWAAFTAKAGAIVRAGDYAALVTDSADDADGLGAESEGPFVPLLEKKVDSSGKKWWKKEIPTLEARLADYGLYGSAFGHRPAAFGIEDGVGRSEPQDYHLIKIDSGMGVPNAPKEADADAITTWQPPYMGHLLIFPHPAELAQQKPPVMQSVGFSKTPIITAPAVPEN